MFELELRLGQRYGFLRIIWILTHCMIHRSTNLQSAFYPWPGDASKWTESVKMNRKQQNIQRPGHRWDRLAVSVAAADCCSSLTAWCLLMTSRSCSSAIRLSIICCSLLWKHTIAVFSILRVNPLTGPCPDILNVTSKVLVTWNLLTLSVQSDDTVAKKYNLIVIGEQVIILKFGATAKNVFNC